MLKGLTITLEQAAFLKENFNQMTQKQLAEVLGLSQDKVLSNMAFLQLKRDYPKKTAYEGLDTIEKVRFIKENIGKITKCRIRQDLQISKSQLDHIVKKHNIIHFPAKKEIVKVDSEFFEHDKHGEWYFVSKED